ncbi:hypothetical protein ACCO45_000896 [Purpureocillium lilacinum]|uniref:Uncharacterized protein n=1 Tax=Purpureocillium lilacinum TaxID=33203 RepID=A0ACC4E5I3_PURLI
MPDRFCPPCWFAGEQTCECPDHLHCELDFSDWSIGKCNTTSNDCAYYPYPGQASWEGRAPMPCGPGFPCRNSDKYCYFKNGEHHAQCW